jgi:hypothetical protein
MRSDRFCRGSRVSGGMVTMRLGERRGERRVGESEMHVRQRGTCSSESRTRNQMVDEG